MNVEGYGDPSETTRLHSAMRAWRERLMRRHLLDLSQRLQLVSRHHGFVCGALTDVEKLVEL